MALHMGSIGLYPNKDFMQHTTVLLFKMMSVSAKPSILCNVYTLLQPAEIMTVVRKHIHGKIQGNQHKTHDVSEPSIYTQTLNMQSNLYNSSTHLLLKL